MNEEVQKNTNDDRLELDVSDEIVVKDERGNYRVLIGGKLEDLPSDFTVVEKKSAEPPAKLFTEEGLVSQEQTTEQLMPPPPAIWQKQTGAAFYFHPEDEAEVNKIVSEKGLEQQIDLSPAVEEIITTSGVVFASANNRQKVKNILLARLKHLREQGETREALLRSMAEGGAGLTENETEKLIDLLIKKMAQIEAGEYLSPQSTELDELIRQSDETYKFPVGDVLPKNVNDILAETLAQTKPEFTHQPEWTEPEPKIADEPAPPVKPQRQSIYTDTRTRVSDVRPVGRVRSPVEELRHINLVDIHRLGTSPIENIGRIKDKIEILEEESFNKKVEGIKAWRQSPLYNMYLDIGRQSMEQGKSISQIIMERGQLDQETLTIQEFEKISDLNQELRY